jgi:hypothetical protein
MRYRQIDCAQSGFEARWGASVSSNVNGTTTCASHVCGKTGARQIVEANTECGAYSWAICGRISKSGLRLTGVLGNRCRRKNEHRSARESKLQRFSHCFSPSIFCHTPSDRATARIHSPSRRREAKWPLAACAMCGRLRVGKENLHGASLVGAAVCSAC